MMRALVGLALCVAGCTSDAGGPGGGPGDGSGSGSGSGSDMPLPDPDTDGDGFSDLVDNCAMLGNPDQRDHDDDALGDACDRCPHVVDSGKDTDGDGVGDKCDPNPTTAGDRIAFFEGFYDPVDWQTVVGGNAWVAVDGTLRQPNVDAAYQLIRDDTPNLTEVFVDARMRVNALANTSFGQRRSTGLILSHRDETHFLFCGLAALPQGAEVNAGEVYTDWFGGTQYDYTQDEFPGQMAGAWLTLQARTTRRNGVTRLECVSHRAGSTGATAYQTEGDLDGDIGVGTQGVDASFDYVFVVAAPASSS